MDRRLGALGACLLAGLSLAALAELPADFEALMAKAQAGDAEAQYSVGKALQKDRQYNDAFHWFEKASAQGHLPAMNSFAQFYELGIAVRQSHQRGFEIYSRAADLGSAEAMWNISNMYRAGELGESPDFVAACAWAIRAERFSDPADNTWRSLKSRVERVLPRLEHALTSDQLAQCKKDGEAWSPRQAKGTTSGS